MTLIVLVLAVLTALQLIRIFELSSKARKRAEYEITDQDNNNQQCGGDIYQNDGSRC